MQYILAGNFSITFFLSGLLILKKRKQSFDFVMTAFFVLLLFSYTLTLVYHDHTFNNHGFNSYVSSLLYLYPPLLFKYYRNRFFQAGFSYKLVLLFVPFVLSQIALLFFDNREITDTLILVGSVVYQMIVLWQIERRNKQLHIAVKQREELVWFQYCVRGLSIFYALNIINYYLIFNGFFISYHILDYVVILLEACILLFLGFYGVVKTSVFLDQKGQSTICRKSEEEKKRLDETFCKIDRKLREEKLYLHPELNKQILADKLGIQGYALSQAINSQGVHFNSYINTYRLKAFWEKSNAEGRHIKVVELAKECGFKSKSTFNRQVKEMTGLTPSELAAKKEFPIGLMA